MRKIIAAWALFCLSISVGQAQTQNFTLTGTITGKSKPFLYFRHYLENRTEVLDSVKITNGKFSYSGKLNEPTRFFITAKSKFNPKDPEATSLFFEAAPMTLELVAGDFKKAKLVGSQMQAERDQLELEKKPVMDQLQPYLDQYEVANKIYNDAKKANKNEDELELLKEKAADIKSKFAPFNKQLNEIDQQFINTHPDSYLTAELLLFKVSSLKPEIAQAYYGQLTPRVQQSVWGKEVRKNIDRMINGSPGSKAKDFDTKDINGEPLKLSDYQGKYVLLDFWASWCVPCRKSNPHLIKIYEQYKAKGLEIIGISDDDSNPKAWHNAVQMDGIGIWKHVLRGLKKTENGFDNTNDISDSYGISSLPTKILIDPQGVIIGRYGSGGENDEAMDKKLEQIFNN